VEELVQLVSAHAPADAVTWYRKFFPSADQALSQPRFFAAFAGCGRRMKGATAPSGAEIQCLRAAGAQFAEVYSIADWARLALLLQGLRLVEAEHRVPLYKEALRKGDSGEQVSALRALPFLPHAEAYLEWAVDACRTNVKDVFAALANDNPYPARFFPELNFNQLVMKALFLGVPARRIVGIQERITQSLSKMAADYASERRAAGRSVSEDVLFIQQAQTA
jgi:hypothetical protein